MTHMDTTLAQLEERIGYRFKNRSLLEQALTHPSYRPAEGAVDHNQRLEFLGDAVLGFILAEFLFRQKPDEREGNLTKFRSILVRGKQLCALAQEIRLVDFIRIAEPERALIERGNTAILEDAFEAILGAVYLDGGQKAAQTAVCHIFGDVNKRLEAELAALNPKGRLQELLQPSLGNEAIEYRVTGQSGPDHARQFEVEVWIQGTRHGSGRGLSKRLAEEAAARKALESVTESHAEKS